MHPWHRDLKEKGMIPIKSNKVILWDDFWRSLLGIASIHLHFCCILHILAFKVWERFWTNSYTYACCWSCFWWLIDCATLFTLKLVPLNLRYRQISNFHVTVLKTLVPWKYLERLWEIQTYFGYFGGVSNQCWHCYGSIFGCMAKSVVSCMLGKGILAVSAIFKVFGIIHFSLFDIS